MSTEFNYVARLDTSQIMSGLSEIRSQVGMALGGAGGFGGGSLSQTNFGGGAATGINQMMSSMSTRGGGLFGGTFTDPAMAFSPHYGMQGAQTTLEQEGLITGRNGMAMAARMAPPGVSAGEFAMAAMGNNIERSIQAQQAASLAGEAALMSSAGGLLGGSLAMSMIGTPLGGMAGGKLATRFFGAGAAGGGRALGGIAGGLGAMFLASDYIGGAIDQHYGEVEQNLGIQRELADIVGSGRGLTRSQSGELGIAARLASKDIKMDVNQMGDIMALSREAGMLPSSTDPGKARQQIAEYAAAIREGAESLHTSFAHATEIIKKATKQGLTIEEGLIRATNVGQDPGAGIMYGVGVGAARGMGFTGAHGGQLFSNAYGQAGAAGISGEETAILGGRMGVASLIGGTQLAAVSGPMGTMQLMAARGGEPLGGIMGLPGQALDAMSQGGDFMSNMGKFMVHGDEYRRGLGSKGIRAMAMQQLEGMGDLISDLMPGMSGNEAKRFAAMNMYGMTGTQAEAYVGGMGSGAGGDGGATRRLQAATLAYGSQSSALGAAMSRLPGLEERASFGWGYASEGAMGGMLVGSVFPVIGTGVGTAVGAAGGFVAGNFRAMAQTTGDIIEGISHWNESSSEKAIRLHRKAEEAFDRSEEGVKRKMGWLSGDPESASRGMGADLSGTTLRITTSGPRAMAMTENTLRLAGLTPVPAGPGTMQSGDKSWSTKDIQRVTGWMGGKALTTSERDMVSNAVFSGMTDKGAKERWAKTHGTAGYANLNEHDKYAHTIGAAKSDLQRNIDIVGTENPQSTLYRDATMQIGRQAAALVENIEDKTVREKIKQSFLTHGWGQGSAYAQYLQEAGINLDPLRKLGQSATRILGSGISDTRGDQRRLEEDANIKAFGTKGYTDVADKALQQKRMDNQRAVVRAAMQDKGYQEAMADAQAGRGTRESINAKLQLAYKRARNALNTGGGDDESPIDISSVDVDKEIARDSGGKQSLRSGVRAERGAGVHESRRPMAKPVAERAIGFGEHESAMANINKSLERTAKMIEALYRSKGNAKGN